MDEAKRIRVVVIGQGYVGLPVARAAVSAGHAVTGLEINAGVVSALNSGLSVIDDLRDDELQQMLAQGYEATIDPAVLAEADVIVVCVPTPLDDHREPDLTALHAAIAAIAEHMRSSTLVIVESTTYPGTTDEVVLAALAQRGWALDSDFHLAFSPERIDPGNKAFGLQNTPKVVGGVSAASTEAAARFYSSFVSEVVTTRGAREAETAKLLENTYRHVNIALVNELARFCAELDIDVWDVIRAAQTKPFGFEAFYPGPGVGGHCIPIDPSYLNFAVKRRVGHPFRFVELAEEINASMPRYVADRVLALLNDRGVTMKGSTILLLGVAYKANVSDARETPAVPLAEILLGLGAEVWYHDPRVGDWAVAGAAIKRADDVLARCADADAVILLQAHAEYDVDELASASALFFDTRGVTRGAVASRL